MAPRPPGILLIWNFLSANVGGAGKAEWRKFPASPRQCQRCRWQRPGPAAADRPRSQPKVPKGKVQVHLLRSLRLRPGFLRKVLGNFPFGPLAAKLTDNLADVLVA